VEIKTREIRMAKAEERRKGRGREKAMRSKETKKRKGRKEKNHKSEKSTGGM